MLWASSLSYFLLKDDIFFSQPPTHDILQSLALHQSLTFTPSLSIKKIPSPNLSPVTSPSGLLYDNEPLFDGLEDLDLDLSQPDSPPIFHQPHQDYFAVLPNPTCTTDDSPNDQSPQLEWSALLDHLDDTDTNFIPRGIKRKRPSTPLEPKSPFTTLLRPTVFESLTDAGVDWCRYCGTTESVNWRPGPWGKRTLCNKHGCDYKGYGLVSRLPRLDLSAFTNEPIEDRICPIIQEFCVVCKSPAFTADNLLVTCQGGCSRAYHQSCRSPIIKPHLFRDTPWYCSSACRTNRLKNRVVVDLPRNHLPLMIRNHKRHS
ncbi:hypothetical protein CLU79DRAFT_836830 [Phycomyces nitens]|nr:hypothetical protein CLU79DRAFT_836830 [Phycomyces nitens]